MKKTIDLTKPLDNLTRAYRMGEYHDPPFSISDWCEVREQGFWVSKLEMGTQTGTHLDAPAHFLEGAETLEKLDINTCFGPYFLVHMGKGKSDSDFARTLSRYRGESILLLLSPPHTGSIPSKRLQSLLSLGCRLWIVMGSVTVENSEPLHFHRELAQEGVYLVEDLDEEAMHSIEPNGEIMALPLRMEGVSGSPCRVILSMKENPSPLAVE